MYWIEQENKEDRRRNTLSIRFTDREHRLVCDTAWKQRLSASGMIRDIILGQFQRLGILDQETQLPNPAAAKKGGESQQAHKTVGR